MAIQQESGLAAAEEFQLSLKTAKMEMAYEKALHRIDSILRDEKCRESNVRVLLAEHDRDSFRSQNETANSELEKAEKLHSSTDEQLAHAQDAVVRLQNTLRTRAREIESLKTEISSLKSTSSDHNKAQAEKSASIREIAALKQEVAHLRSQSVSQQSIIAEKQDLDRQVSSLEVELENTKRSLERTRQRDLQQHEDSAQLEQLNDQYLKEKQDRERLEQEASNSSRQCKVLEGRVKKLEAKLEEATEQLGGAEDRLHGAEEGMSGEAEHPEEEESDRPRKTLRFGPEMTIATPGDARVTNKKPQKATAAPGAKSSFSITPFLNRTRDSADQDMSSEEEQESPVPEKKRPAARPGKKSEKSNRAGSNTKSSAGASQSTKQSTESKSGGGTTTQSGAASKKGGTVPKKRTLTGGGREGTIFDEDDEPAGRDRARKFVGLQSLGAQGRPVRRLGGAPSIDGGFNFSPLKRNARAM